MTSVKLLALHHGVFTGRVDPAREPVGVISRVIWMIA